MVTLMYNNLHWQVTGKKFELESKSHSSDGGGWTAFAVRRNSSYNFFCVNVVINTSPWCYYRKSTEIQMFGHLSHISKISLSCTISQICKNMCSSTKCLLLGFNITISKNHSHYVTRILMSWTLSFSNCKFSHISETGKDHFLDLQHYKSQRIKQIKI